MRDYQISGQLGLEPTLQEYIDNTVLWAREVWRVLRDDGTLWLNLGDSYNGSGGEHKAHHKNDASWQYKNASRELSKGRRASNEATLKPKDLMMVPARVAIALQDDGWYVRSDIIWHKPNPMPESVQDRPTKSHEYIFLLTKQKRYYYDVDAIREPVKDVSIERLNRAVSNKHKNLDDNSVPPGSKPHTIHKKRARNQYKELKSGGKTPRGKNSFDGSDHLVAPFDIERGRNKRTVWTITTKPYPGAHFATFPPELPEICIKAGTSEKGVCPVCGAQWVRAKKVISAPDRDNQEVRENRIGVIPGRDKACRMNSKDMASIEYETVGWKPTCDHNEEPVPALVLDPFCGSGTTIAVANALGRKGIGIDLSWDYLQLAKERTGQKALEEWINGKQAEANLEGLPMFTT